MRTGQSWSVDDRQLTDTAIVMLRRALEKQGIAESLEAGKTITLRVNSRHAFVHVNPFSPLSNSNVTITLEADLGDGTEAFSSADNQSPLGPQRAFDGAILFALNELLSEAAFVAYLNKSDLDPPKPAASTTTAATVVTPSTAAASATRFPQTGDTWTYRLTEPRRTDGPKQREFVVKVSAASPSSVVEQVLIGNIPSGEATHGSQQRSVLPLAKSLFSPYLLVFNEDLRSLGDFRRLRIDDPVCALHYHCEATGRLVAQERITVPAGSFDTWKVEVTQNWRPTTTTGSLLTSQEIGGRILMIWYAKDTKRAIKYQSRPTFGSLPPMETDFVLELLSYKLQ